MYSHKDELKKLKLEAHLLVEKIASHPYAIKLLTQAICGLKMYAAYKANRSSRFASNNLASR